MKTVNEIARHIVGEWLSWIGRGAPEGQPFRRRDSVCFFMGDRLQHLAESLVITDEMADLVFDTVTNRMIEMSHEINVGRHRLDLLVSMGSPFVPSRKRGSSISPFWQERKDNRCHLNEARIKWAREFVAGEHTLKEPQECIES